MKDTRRRRMIFLLVTILLIASVAYAGFYSKTLRRMRAQEPVQKNQGPSTYKAEEVTVPPILHSKIKTLEIAGVRLKDQGQPSATVEIDVLNKDEQTLVALSLSAGPENETPSISMDALADANRPTEGIKPNAVITLRWNLSAIAEGYPIEISSAIFADGREEGSPLMLQSIHTARDKFTRDLAAERARKEGRP